MDEGLRSELSKQGIFTTTLEEIYNWGRKNSVWPLQFGLACCAIEMIASAISGGPFKQGYNVLKGIDRYIPVDVHIPGCPPRPEALIHAFMTLQKKIDEQRLSGNGRPRHLDPDAPSEFPVPQFGEHDLV